MLVCCVIGGAAGLVATFASEYDKAILYVCKALTAFTTQGSALIATVYVIEIATPL